MPLLKSLIPVLGVVTAKCHEVPTAKIVALLVLSVLVEWPLISIIGHGPYQIRALVTRSLVLPLLLLFMPGSYRQSVGCVLFS
ncbi:hypothetical protein D3C81_1469850 [compost metagenome]